MKRLVGTLEGDIARETSHLRETFRRLSNLSVDELLTFTPSQSVGVFGL